MVSFDADVPVDWAVAGAGSNKTGRLRGILPDIGVSGSGEALLPVGRGDALLVRRLKAGGLGTNPNERHHGHLALNRFLTIPLLILPIADFVTDYDPRKRFA